MQGSKGCIISLSSGQRKKVVNLTKCSIILQPWHSSSVGRASVNRPWNSFDVGLNLGHGIRLQEKNLSRTIWRKPLRTKWADWESSKKQYFETKASCLALMAAEIKPRMFFLRPKKLTSHRIWWKGAHAEKEAMAKLLFHSVRMKLHF